MPYVFDTSSFRVLQNYFPGSFPSFWEKWQREVKNGIIISVREVKRELDIQAVQEHLIDWCDGNSNIFLGPIDDESDFIGTIFAVPHFRQLISERNQLLGMPVADPFVIASASVNSGTVVTEEALRPNAARIPNVCQSFGIPCIDMQQFLVEMGWSF